HHDGGEHADDEDGGADEEGLAAQPHPDLPVCDEPGGAHHAERADGGFGRDWRGHWMTSLKIWASDGCLGVKLLTGPAAIAVRSTRWAVSGESASNRAKPPSNSMTSMPGSSRSQPRSPSTCSS